MKLFLAETSLTLSRGKLLFLVNTGDYSDEKFLALLAFIVAGIGVWAGYSLWEKQQSSGDYYAEKVNLALRNNELLRLLLMRLIRE